MKRIMLYIIIMVVVASCASEPAKINPIALLKNKPVSAGESIVIGRIEKNSLISGFKNNYIDFYNVDNAHQYYYLINDNDDGWFFLHLKPGEYFFTHIIVFPETFMHGLSKMKNKTRQIRASITVPQKPSALYIGTLRLSAGIWTIVDESNLVNDVVVKKEFSLSHPVETVHMQVEKL